MATNRDQLLRHLKLQDALLKREAEQSLYNYVRQAWSILEPDVLSLLESPVALGCDPAPV
jgi:hypothetical protein